MPFEKGMFDSIMDCLSLKVFGSFLLLLVDFLFGDINLPFKALWALVVLDLLSKWMQIGDQTLKRMGHKGNLFTGVFWAWKCGDINADVMGSKFVKKIAGYIWVLIGSHLLTLAVPSMPAYGYDWARVPEDLVRGVLALTEFVSITRNWRDMGVDAMSSLCFWAQNKKDQLTGERPGAGLQSTIQGGFNNGTSTIPANQPGGAPRTGQE